MDNFKIVKKGYSQLEVDSYIEKLKEDYEARLAEQKDRIFYLKDQLDKISNSSDNELVTSLVGAVERARMIETSSKNIYELETKKLSLLYSKMETLLTDENIRNDRSIKKELLELIQDCRSSLQSNIIAQSENVKKTTSGDPIKTLLSKMIDFNQATADYALTMREARVLEESNKKAIKLIPTDEVIRKEVPSSVKVVQVKRKISTTTERQAQSVLSNTETTNEFNKYLSQNNNVNGANFENIMFTSSTNNKYSNSSSSNASNNYSNKYNSISKSKDETTLRYSKDNKKISEGINEYKLNSSNGQVSSSKQNQETLLKTNKATESKDSKQNTKSNFSVTNEVTKNKDNMQKESISTKSSSSTSVKAEAKKEDYKDYQEKQSSTQKTKQNAYGNEKATSSIYASSRYNDIIESLSKASSSRTKKETKETAKSNTESKNAKTSSKSIFASNNKLTKTEDYKQSSSKKDSVKDDEIIIQSRTKTSKKEEQNPTTITTITNSKLENSNNGKTESKQFSVSGTSGNTSFTASASYKSSYSSSSVSNPNDELSDEEFLRAYLSDLEFEEEMKNHKNANITSSSSYQTTTKSSIITTSSSSSSTITTNKKSSSNAYITGGKMGDYSPNETGFDLKEAVNPKEDLDEIMKAFDFYNDNKKKK